MTLNQLRYLVAIVDAGLVISRAAERVHTTQSGLSKQLKQIETEMGQPLFQRRGYNLSALTPCGQRVIEHGRAVLAEMAGIRSLVAQRAPGMGRALRIATTPTQARYVLPAALERLKRGHQQLQIALRVGGDEEVLGWAESGQIDLALASTQGLRPRRVAAVPLYRWQRLALLPAGHPLAAIGRAATLADLAAHPLVTYASARDPVSDFSRAFALHGVKPTIATCTADADLIKTYVRAGLGVGIVAETAYERERDADLQALPLGNLFRPCTAWAAFPARCAPLEQALELAAELAPHMELRSMRRTLALGEAGEWPAPPGWDRSAA
ncbi:DNA-binding transcriptional LysR family regulator [Tahibacter aquaticus]|uniref:DNA-binding transcriptional LysR family regulator n=1 Tax=Tahibacter aquaticus TaxID=520092 RepID=A0A4R6YR07_9GAMM|nr:LysR substrate-binding domain-containing protein [Tahibacter aquaticus]TDR40405.1 DNA-binding transcriptional LysR family regulator [Tahibacter aquaticus]